MPALIVITGCSGGGKSTLLAELARRGFSTMDEPGRAVVRAERAAGGSALPWRDARAFARACLARALAQHGQAAPRGPVFFDRSLLDALCAPERIDGALSAADRALIDRHRYAPTVALLPPWPALFTQDAERRHDFAAAVAEYTSLQAFYVRHGYTLVELPPDPVAARADRLLAQFGAQ